MDLHADAKIPFPRDVVFRTYRDHLVELVPYLPNVRSVTIRSRAEEGSRVSVVSDWQGGGDLPSLVRGVMSDAMLGWVDHATWEEEAFACVWRTETRALADAIRCEGRNAYADAGGEGTRLEIRGRIDVDARKIRGVPGLVAGKVGRVVEEFLVTRIAANVLETAKGLEAYLRSKQA